MILHCISPFGGIIFVVVLSHFIFLNFKGYTFDFVKGLVLNFFIQISDLYESKVTEVFGRIRRILLALSLAKDCAIVILLSYDDLLKFSKNF